MGETLEALHRLQEVELKLAGIRSKRESKVRRVEAQRRQAVIAEQRLDQMKRAVRDRQMRLDSLQLEVGSREVSVNKHREALNSARTNKEYSAILAAMNTEKADNAKLESGILELMDEIHSLGQEVAQAEAERARHLENVHAAEATLREFDEGCRNEVDVLQEKREHCSATIAPTTLAAFTRVAEHHDGEAMASVVKIHPKRDEYICEGCNMKLTLESVNALQSRDEIQLCHVCGRILYLETTFAK